MATESKTTEQHDLVTRETSRASAILDARFETGLAVFLETDPPQWPGFESVKQSTVRQVLSGTIPGPEGAVPVHLKLFRAGRLSDRARDVLRGARATREFENLVTARERGLPCVEPLMAARIAGSGGSRSLLVTRTEPGEPLPRGPLSPTDAATAGQLLRRAHDAGLHARDLHPGNILRRPNGELVLLDLTSASFANPLEDSERARALAFFCLDLDGLVHDPAARPLVAAYGASKAVLDRAFRDGRRLRNRALQAFGRRAFRECRHTKVERRRRAPRWFLHVPAKDGWPLARELAEKQDGLITAKEGRRGGVYLHEEIVAKRREAAAARRLMEAAYYLEFAKVPHPQPVALQTFHGSGWFFSRRIAGKDLETELREGLLDHQALVESAQSLGNSVGRLHALGIRNRDLKLSNLMRRSSSGAIEIVILDLDGIRRNAPTDVRGQGADLGRLLAAFREAGNPGGQAVLQAFLHSYTRALKCLRSRPNLRQLLQLTEARASEWASAHRNTPD